MSTLNRCKYCLKQVADDEVEVFICDRCCCYAHLNCIRCDKVTHLKGDYLFIYECGDCAFEKKDVLTRMKLSWAQVIHLALYNLTVSAAGRQGFFRWKEDICEFIEKNWTHLMPDREKTATWGGTIAGVLSVHCKLFKSGSHLFNESGWWSLQEVRFPNPNPENYKLLKTQFHMCINKKNEHDVSTDYGRGKRQRKGKKNNTFKVLKTESEKCPVIDNLNGHDYAGYEQKIVNADLCVKIDISDKITENIQPDENIGFLENVVVKTEANFADEHYGISNLFDTSEHPFLGDDTISSSFDNPFCLPFLPEDMSDYNPTLFNDAGFNDLHVVGDSMNGLCDDADKNEDSENVLEAEKEPEQVETSSELVPLAVKEELDLLNKISECVNVLNTDASVRRLCRKLSVRKVKRQTHQRLFNLKEVCEGFAMKDNSRNVLLKKDALAKDYPVATPSGTADSYKKAYHHPALCNIHVLDRFFCFNVSDVTNHSSIHVRLVGNSSGSICYRSIVSPYTSRILKPYIRRDFHTVPLKLRVLRDILKRQPNGDIHNKFPIDYCYVQPSHVPAINALCSDFFWPGIDMTESLQYPEFSCVVLYRKLVIGFAFMVPDVKYNEAYISFILVHPDWQCAGIGSHMLYHLIQTCMGKDITLHVSPNNSSIMLYQKFGFKSEKLILGFYEKYLPESSKACRHALLLRLRR